MTKTPLKTFVLPPIVLSAAVFGILTLPLAFCGSKPLTIKINNEPIFYGQLRDIAFPYLGLTTALSLGAGVTSIAVTGWRFSCQKSATVNSQLSDLEQHLKQKEEQLKTLQLSESQLAASRLSSFLDDKVEVEEVPTRSAAVTAQLPEVRAVETPEWVVQPLVITEQPTTVQQPTVQAAAANFACAQAFLGYSQLSPVVKQLTTGEPPVPMNNNPQLTSSSVKELNTQIQEIMAQMASIQAALQTPDKR